MNLDKRIFEKISVYCASSEKISKDYFELTDKIAETLVNQGITVVCGGGGKGLMGQLADSVLERQGTIVGILPKFMIEVEWQHRGLSELILVEDMAIRKKKLMEVDALIALPGGCGTLEELMEAITLKRLGKFTKPIIIYNHKSYYDPLIMMLEKTIEEKFMRPEHRQIWSVITEVDQLIPALHNAPSWDESAIKFAAV